MRERLVFEVADDELDLGVLAVLGYRPVATVRAGNGYDLERMSSS